jgi:UDP-N-acetylglucosamine acyltransferase
MTTIDPTARIDAGAHVGNDVSIGPYCVVGANVKLGDGVKLVGQCHISGHTEIGAGTRVGPFASLGSPPQSTGYRGEPTKLVVGTNCLINESVTMNTGTASGGGITRVGDKCMFMVGSHVGHDCIVGSNVTLANAVLLAGHVEVGDGVFIGGGSAVHQFTRIGEGVMIAGISGVAADIIPYALVLGHRAAIGGLNVVGLKRRGFSRQDIHRVRGAYAELFEGGGEFRARAEAFATKYAEDEAIGKIAKFLAVKTKRPLMRFVHGAGRVLTGDASE